MDRQAEDRDQFNRTVSRFESDPRRRRRRETNRAVGGLKKGKAGGHPGGVRPTPASLPFSSPPFTPARIVVRPSSRSIHRERSLQQADRSRPDDNLVSAVAGSLPENIA